MMIPACQDDDTKVERSEREHIAATAANAAHESGRHGWDGREERRNTLAKIAEIYGSIV